MQSRHCRRLNVARSFYEPDLVYASSSRSPFAATYPTHLAIAA